MSLHGKLRKNTFNKNIHSYICKWFKEFKAKNVSIKTTKMISIFPTGDYKMIFYIYGADEKTQHAEITMIGNVLSSNKDTFG